MKAHVTKHGSVARKPSMNPSVSQVHPLCDDRFTALPPSIDIAALATLYNSQPKSQVAHEYLLEQARRSLLKYELAQTDLELAAESLARAMHLLIEQHGVDQLPLEELTKLERDILEWYGLVPAANESVASNTNLPHWKIQAKKKRKKKLSNEQS